MKKQILSAIKVFPILLGFALISCTDPIMPVLPVWDVGMNVPFATENYSISEFLAQNPNVKITPNGDSTFDAVIFEGTITDTIKMNLDKATIDKLMSVTEGLFVIELVNAMPASAVAEMQFTDDGYSPLLIPQTVSGLPFEIRPAQPRSDGTEPTPVRSKIEVMVTRSDIQQIVNSSWFIITLKISTPGSLPLTFNYNDFLKMIVYAHIDIKTDFGS
jgi:hypothetical protein